MFCSSLLRRRRVIAAIFFWSPILSGLLLAGLVLVVVMSDHMSQVSLIHCSSVSSDETNIILQMISDYIIIITIMI